MYNMIERYISKLTIPDINHFLINKDIYLNKEELNFSYDFLKKNWYSVLKNPSSLNFSRLKPFISEENIKKLEQLFKEYAIKYSRYL